MRNSAARWIRRGRAASVSKRSYRIFYRVDHSVCQRCRSPVPNPAETSASPNPSESRPFKSAPSSDREPDWSRVRCPAGRNRFWDRRRGQRGSSLAAVSEPLPLDADCTGRVGRRGTGFSGRDEAGRGWLGLQERQASPGSVGWPEREKPIRLQTGAAARMWEGWAYFGTGGGAHVSSWVEFSRMTDRGPANVPVPRFPATASRARASGFRRGEARRVRRRR